MTDDKDQNFSECDACGKAIDFSEHYFSFNYSEEYAEAETDDEIELMIEENTQLLVLCEDCNAKLSEPSIQKSMLYLLRSVTGDVSDDDDVDDEECIDCECEDHDHEHHHHDGCSCCSDFLTGGPENGPSLGSVTSSWTEKYLGKSVDPAKMSAWNDLADEKQLPAGYSVAPSVFMTEFRTRIESDQDIRIYLFVATDDGVISDISYSVMEVSADGELDDLQVPLYPPDAEEAQALLESIL